MVPIPHANKSTWTPTQGEPITYDGVTVEVTATDRAGQATEAFAPEVGQVPTTGTDIRALRCAKDGGGRDVAAHPEPRNRNGSANAGLSNGDLYEPPQRREPRYSSLVRSGHDSAGCLRR